VNANKTPYLRRTEARRAERIDPAQIAIDNSLLRPEDGYFELVCNKAIIKYPTSPQTCHIVAALPCVIVKIKIARFYGLVPQYKFSISGVIHKDRSHVI